jgi:hypothetical protein
VGYHCWNDELIAKPGAELTLHWKNIHQWLKSQSESLAESISNSIEQVCTLLRQNERHAPQSLGNLLSVMESRKRNIIHVVYCHIMEIVESTEYDIVLFSRGLNLQF